MEANRDSGLKAGRKEKQGKGGFAKAALLGMLLTAGTAMSVLADVEKLRITQIRQEGADVFLYMNALRADERSADDLLRAEDLSVGIDEGISLPVDSLQDVRTIGEGTAYTFCIDISKSVTEKEMEQIRSALQEFVTERLDAADYAKIVTIGSRAAVACDMTQEKEALREAVSGIGRTADETFLYSGLCQVLEAYKKHVDLQPERGAVVVFTDGMDDSDGAYTQKDVLEISLACRIPVYVVGLKGNDPQADLGAVGDIARQSGGAVYSYHDMSARDALQLVDENAQNAWRLTVHPGEAVFGRQDIIWKVKYAADGYTVTSAAGYTFSLSREGVGFAPEESGTESVQAGEPVTESAESGEAAAESAKSGKAAAEHDGSGEAVTERVPSREADEVLTEAESTALSGAVPTGPEDGPQAGDGQEMSAAKRGLPIGFIIAAAVLMLAGLILLLMTAVRYSRLKRGHNVPEDEDASGFFSKSDPPGSRGAAKQSEAIRGNDRGAHAAMRAGERDPLYFVPEAPEDEQTVGLFDGQDKDQTIDGALMSQAGAQAPVRVDFEIRFGGGESSVTRFLGDSLVLGRGDGCDVNVAEGGTQEEQMLTSRMHARLIRKGDNVFVRDERSRNHTYLNGAVVDGETPVSDGDVLSLGKASVTLHIENQQ